MKIENLELFVDAVRADIKKAIDKINVDQSDICIVSYPIGIRLRIPSNNKNNDDLIFSVPFFNGTDQHG